MSRVHVSEDQQSCTKYQCHPEVTRLCNHYSSPVMGLAAFVCKIQRDRDTDYKDQSQHIHHQMSTAHCLHCKASKILSK